MTNLNLKNFEFKDTQLTFPIGVFISHNQTNIYFWIFIFSIIITIFAQLKYSIFALSIWIFLIYHSFYMWLSKKPKLVLYPDKIVLTNHGLTKPKIFAWQDCIFEIEKTKSINSNNKETMMLYLLSKNDQGQQYRFCVLNLNAIRFNDKQFGVDEHLAIFQKIKNGEFQK